jgi:hypothetical protein
LVGARATSPFPFGIAIVLPPAGLILGLLELRQDREIGIRLIVVALLAALVWVGLFVA